MKGSRVKVRGPTFPLQPCPGVCPALARTPHTEKIHQTTLARIGGSSDHNVCPRAEPLTTPGISQVGTQCSLQGLNVSVH